MRNGKKSLKKASVLLTTFLLVVMCLAVDTTSVSAAKIKLNKTKLTLTQGKKYRLKVKGGLTGYAQVYGKYNTTAYDKLKLDLMYIQNYSIWLDIEIIFKTIKILLIKESTEGFSEEQAAAITKECGDLTETMEEKDRKL